MSSGGGDDDDGALTLQLLPLLDQPKPSLPNTHKQNPNTLSLTHIQNPNPSDGGGDRSIQLPTPPLPNPSSKQKAKKFKTKQPQITKTQPNIINMPPNVKIAMSEKAKSFKWKKWSPKITPSVATLPCMPHLLCAMHGELLKSKVSAQDDLYSQLPTTITSEKRFNLKQEAAYLLFGKRYPGEKAGQTNRQFLGDGIKARWRNQGSMDFVAGPNGRVIGMHFSIILEYFRCENGWTASDWSADEYISVTSEVDVFQAAHLKPKSI